MSLFQSAAYTIAREGDEERETKQQRLFNQRLVGGGLSKDRWARSVIQGADKRSPRWRHALAIGGLLIGFEGRERTSTSSSSRRVLGSALVKAINLSLESLNSTEDLGHQCIALVINHTFDLLPDLEKAQINYDVRV